MSTYLSFYGLVFVGTGETSALGFYCGSRTTNCRGNENQTEEQKDFHGVQSKILKDVNPPKICLNALFLNMSHLFFNYSQTLPP